MKTLRRYVAAGCFGLAFGIGAGRIIYDNGRIDGGFLAVLLFAIAGVLIVPWED